MFYDDARIRSMLRIALDDCGLKSRFVSNVDDLMQGGLTEAALVLVGCPLYQSPGETEASVLNETASKTAVVLMSDAVTAFGPSGFDPSQLAEAVRLTLTPRDRGRRPSEPGRRAVSHSFESLVGESPPMQRTKRLLRRIASSPASTVLLTGESGTGKGLASRLIHYNSKRAREPFVNITCSALPEALLESELFGHEKGAFTDAREQKLGLLEIADNGSVFLDEIGELSPGLQAKLLRFLEERAFRRVGGSQDILVDVRIIAATNRDLRAEVDAGRFREDLYYRLSVVPIEIPALRERREDLPALVAHYLSVLSQDLGRAVRGITLEAERLLESHDWPGNVRELRNVLERAVLLADTEVLDVSDFESFSETGDLVAHAGVQLPLEGLDLAEVERSLLLQALTRTGWNKTHAAKLLGLNRDQIRYRIAKYSLSTESIAGPNRS